MQEKTDILSKRGSRATTRRSTARSCRAIAGATARSWGEIIEQTCPRSCYSGRKCSPMQPYAALCSRCIRVPTGHPKGAQWAPEGCPQGTRVPSGHPNCGSEVRRKRNSGNRGRAADEPKNRTVSARRPHVPAARIELRVSKGACSLAIKIRGQKKQAFRCL